MAGQVITIAQQKGGSGKTTLAVNLAVAFCKKRLSVALVDTDPQGSLGRWFMMRLEEKGEPDIEFTTSSAWGINYEIRKLTDAHDIVIIDTPPKIDSDLKPSLRAADLVLVPVASSHVDLWATEGLIELAERVGKSVLVVLNRTRPHTRLGAEIASLAAESEAEVAEASLGNRVVYAETLGQGRGALEARRSPVVTAEVEALTAEVLVRLETGE